MAISLDDLPAGGGLDAALELARRAHAGQVDKLGVDYFDGHIVAVVAALEGNLGDQIVGALHDTIEDTDVTPELLRAAGFCEDVIGDVVLLTHKEGVPDVEYLGEVARVPRARRVKWADVGHNSGPERLGQIEDQATRLRLEAKYATARSILSEATQKEVEA
jgi:hypothetical protein